MPRLPNADASAPVPGSSANGGDEDDARWHHQQRVAPRTMLVGRTATVTGALTTADQLVDYVAGEEIDWSIVYRMFLRSLLVNTLRHQYQVCDTFGESVVSPWQCFLGEYTSEATQTDDSKRNEVCKDLNIEETEFNNRLRRLKRIIEKEVKSFRKAMKNGK